MRSLAVPAIILICLFLLLLFVVPGRDAEQATDVSQDDAQVVEEQIVESAWLTGMDGAKRKARETGRPIFALFTGSTWCPPCQYMESRVFNRKPFADFADEHLALVKFDVPAGRARTEAEKAAEAMHTAYGIEGVPTMLLLDAEGNRLATVPLSVLPRSAGEYVALLQATLDGLNLPDKTKTTNGDAAPENTVENEM